MKRSCKLMGTLLLILSIIMTNSCTDAESQSNAEESSSQTGSEAETTNRYDTGLEAIDYDGAEINFLIPDDGAGRWVSKEVDAESENGDIINDAVYKRNQFIEEKYNVKIASIHSDRGEMVSKLAKNVQSGDNDFDCAMIPLWNCLSASDQGLLLDLNELENLNFNAEWWDQSSNKAISLLGKQFYAVGDINIMSWDGTAAMFFNKQVIEDYHFEDPYELVDAGKWTLDKYHELTANNARDIDQDGKMGINDLWTSISSDDTIWSMLNSCGIYVVEKDDSDTPYFHELDEKYNDALERLAKLGNIKETFNVHRSYNGNFNENFIYAFDIFANNRTVIYSDVVELANGLRGYDVEFGIIPYPKYDEAQENYISPLNAYASTTITIPASVNDTDRITRIIEDMAASSAEIIRPAYYDVTLNVKWTRDEKSVEMLDIIFSNRVFDIGWLINPGNLKYTCITNPIINGTNNFSSVYASITQTAEAEIEKLIDNIADTN